MNKCCCCLLRTPDKDLNTPYVVCGVTETFSDMLHECFQIQFTAGLDNECGICEECVCRLQDAHDFKLQVQRCQAELQVQLERARSGKDEDPIVKTEKPDDDDYLTEDFLLRVEASVRSAANPERMRQQLTAACFVRLQRLSVTATSDPKKYTHKRVAPERNEELKLKTEECGASVFDAETCREEIATAAGVSLEGLGDRPSFVQTGLMTHMRVSPERDTERTEEVKLKDEECVASVFDAVTSGEQVGTAAGVSLEGLGDGTSTSLQSGLMTHMSVSPERDTERNEEVKLKDEECGASVFDAETCGEKFASRATAVRVNLERLGDDSATSGQSGLMTHTRVAPERDSERKEELDLTFESEIDAVTCGEQLARAAGVSLEGLGDSTATSLQSGLMTHMLVSPERDPEREKRDLTTGSEINTETCGEQLATAFHVRLERLSDDTAISDQSGPRTRMRVSSECDPDRKNGMDEGNDLNTGFEIDIETCRGRFDDDTATSDQSGPTTQITGVDAATCEEQCALKNGTISPYFSGPRSNLNNDLKFSFETLKKKLEKYSYQIKVKSMENINNGHQFTVRRGTIPHYFNGLRSNKTDLKTFHNLNKKSKNNETKLKSTKNNTGLRDPEKSSTIASGLKLIKKDLNTHERITLVKSKKQVIKVKSLKNSNTGEITAEKRGKIRGTGKPCNEEDNICEVCSKQFKNKAGLASHRLAHKTNQSLNCDICCKQFAKKKHLSQHMRLSHPTGEKPYECEVCKKRYMQNCDLNVHKRIHTGSKPYLCDICSKTFTTSSHLSRHIRFHMRDKLYTCDMCKKQFVTRSELIKHIAIHMGTKRYSCDDCGKKFATKSELTIHNRFHTGERPFNCDFCDSKFHTAANRDKHVICVHTKETPYACDTCGVECSTASGLSTHIKCVHLNITPFACELCGKKFKLKHHLGNHLKVHSEEAPFACDLCGKKFKLKHHLGQHQRVHSKSKG